jgi:hypothetical protein
VARVSNMRACVNGMLSCLETAVCVEYCLVQRVFFRFCKNKGKKTHSHAGVVLAFCTLVESGYSQKLRWSPWLNSPGTIRYACLWCFFSFVFCRKARKRGEKQT